LLKRSQRLTALTLSIASVATNVSKHANPKAIDFAQEPREIDLEVGTIVIATGADVCDPSYLTSYAI
jgi:heterodisulfide reductase subunit A-like polyferredoxin